jgi:bifunctional DNA-binding transcriptional regulator/antitoxin component of YhaV-PrlF toxin-antitoxin module
MSKVTSKLQVTLPKVIAAAHNIRPGSEIHFESGIDCIRIVVGGTRSELPVKEKLRLLTEARIRQLNRNKRYQARNEPSRRGWKRDDLYHRGAADRH